VNSAQKALLARLRDIVVQTPKSGAVDAGGRPLHVTRFSQAVDRRAENGAALVEYAREKIYEPPTTSYTALIKARRPDLTVEALVSDSAAEWASEFTEDDRAAARGRLGAMIEAYKKEQEPVEAKAVARDRKILADVSARRIAKGKPGLTPGQEADMLQERAAKRARD
jgi:hypothetical protein